MQSRRSHTNLSNLTLAPLSTRNSLDEDEPTFDDPSTPRWTQRTSYIAGKSAPTTPGILSRSPSHTRLGYSSTTKLASSKSYTQLAVNSTADDLSKSKSTTLLIRSVPSTRKKGRPKSTSRLQTSTDHGEWLFRAGTAISSEAREFKGQSWLASRESSTSLVAQRREDEDGRDVAFDNTNPDLRTPVSGYVSRAHSRSASLKRTSKHGSRTDLSYFATPATSRTRLAADARTVQDDYFGQIHPPVEPLEPDFVDAEEEDEDDEDDGDLDMDADEEKREEAEIAKLTTDRGSGLGGMVDRLLGWTLFDVKEDGDEDSEDDQQVQSEEPLPRQPKTLTTQQSHIQNNSAAEAARRKNSEPPEAQGGWSDAAWLLSVASKVIL